MSVVISQWPCVILIPGIMEDFQHAVVFSHDACPFRHVICVSHDGPGEERRCYSYRFASSQSVVLRLLLHAHELIFRANGQKSHDDRRVRMIMSLVWRFLVLCMLWFPATSPAASPTLPDASVQLYDRVMEEYKHGDYKAALAGFRLFLELHRHSPLAANAQYWIGDCQYHLGHYKEALDSFYNVRAYNPVSPKLAASAFKIGQTYSMLGDHHRARLMFDRVLDQYPNSPEAKLARKAMTVMMVKN
jgi:tol-pal system protein YbgF